MTENVNEIKINQDLLIHDAEIIVSAGEKVVPLGRRGGDDAPADDGHEALRARCREIMEGERLSQRALAKEAGIAEGTFTPWLSGTYQGRNDRVAEGIRRWLAGRERRAEIARSAPPPPPFRDLPSSRQFLFGLTMAKATCDIAAIVGSAGLGKTWAAREFQRREPNVHLVTAEPSTAKAATVLVLIAEAVRVTERNSTRVFRAIGERLRGAEALIIVDEAQHLSLGAFEQLRALHDIYEVGLAFVGNETVHGHLSGGRGGLQHAQLASRFGYRTIQRRPQPGDIAGLIDAWEIADAGERAFLTRIGGKPGALRTLTKTLRFASLLANLRGETRELAHIREAYEQQTRAPEGAAGVSA